MLTSDIVKQLQAELPQLTDDFSEKAQITSASQTLNDLTIGAILGEIPPINSSITIEGLKLSNAVVLEEIIGTTIKLTFTKKHDVTKSKGYEQVYLTNTDSGKDGLYTISEVGQKYIIFDTVETGFTNLIETRTGFNGLFKVKTSALNSITVDLGFPNTLPFYLTDAFIKYGTRVFGLALIDEIDKYLTSKKENQATKTGKPTIYVLNVATTVDSDKTTASDVNAPQNAGSGLKITKIRNFDVIAVYPCNDSVGGFQYLTKCEELELLLDKCLMGLSLPVYTETESKDVIMPLSNNPFTFNGAFYTHQYSYQAQYYQTDEDGYQYPSYKFSEMEINYKLEGDNYEEIKKTDTLTLESE